MGRVQTFPVSALLAQHILQRLGRCCLHACALPCWDQSARGSGSRTRIVSVPGSRQGTSHVQPHPQSCTVCFTISFILQDKKVIRYCVMTAMSTQASSYAAQPARKMLTAELRLLGRDPPSEAAAGRGSLPRPALAALLAQCRPLQRTHAVPLSGYITVPFFHPKHQRQKVHGCRKETYKTIVPCAPLRAPRTRRAAAAGQPRGGAD